MPLQIREGQAGEIATVPLGEALADGGGQGLDQGLENGLGSGQAPTGMPLGAHHLRDPGGDPPQRLGFEFRLEVMFFAVGHAAQAVERTALRKAAGVVGDDLVDRLRPEFGGAVERLDQVGLLLRIVAGRVVVDDPDPSEVCEDDEGFHGIRG